MEAFSNQDNRVRNVTDGVERAEVLAAYRSSGLTQKAFAARAGINYHTFISWLVQQRRAGSSASSASAGKSDDGAAHPRHLEVRLPGEIVVRGHNPADVATLVHSLRNNQRR
jgi:transposase